MITVIDRDTIASIKNPSFASYAGMYLKIYDQFMQQIQQIGLDLDGSDRSDVAASIERLRQQGATFRNDGKSIVVNEISPACVACQTGIGSATFFVSLQCHRDCFYCFNPNQEDYDYFQTHRRNVTDELKQIHAAGQRIKHLALTGGEPLLHKQESVEFFKYATEHFPGTYKRLYTTGDQANEETLKQLQDAGLEEIRLSIRMHDLERGHRHIYDRVALARQYIPRVMIEMPILPGTLEEMKAVLLELDSVQLYSINLLEFCFPLNNAQAFKTRGYRLKQHPFRVLYDYWYAGGLPVAGSELVCLQLVEFALEQKLTMGVHYCSLENKFTGQVYQQNHGQPKPETATFSERDYFLKSAKVFGKDIPKVLKRFKKTGYSRYSTNRDYDYIEFHVDQIASLNGLDVEIGITSSVIEKRADGPCVRELQVDLTHPSTFDLAHDV